MVPEEPTKSAKLSKQNFDVISNRLAVALAKRESLIKSWTASRPKVPAKSQEELDAEDAALFRNEPPHLGLGAPLPSHFLVSEAERKNKTLRAKFFPAKGLKASKARDAEEKAASAKRGLRAQSSDEEEGRSALGRAKKQKTRTKIEPAGERRRNERSGGSYGAEEPSCPGKVKKQELDGELDNSNPDVKVDRAHLLTTVGPLNLLNRDQETVEQISRVLGTVLSMNSTAGLAGKKPDIDPKERKRMKKREKRKRQKLRAPQKAANQQQ